MCFEGGKEASLCSIPYLEFESEGIVAMEKRYTFIRPLYPPIAIYLSSGLNCSALNLASSFSTGSVRTLIPTLK